MLPWYSDINTKVAQIRVREALETRAEVLLTACPSCKANLQIGVNALNSQIQVKDLIEFIVEYL